MDGDTLREEKKRKPTLNATYRASIRRMTQGEVDARKRDREALDLNSLLGAMNLI